MSEELPIPKWLAIRPEDWALPFAVDENEIVPAAIYEVLRFFGELNKVGNFDPESRWTSLTRRSKQSFRLHFDWSDGQIRQRGPLPDLSVIESFLSKIPTVDTTAHKPKRNSRKAKEFKSMEISGIKGPAGPWSRDEWLPFTGAPQLYECEISIRFNLSGKSNVELQNDFGNVLDWVRKFLSSPDGLERSRLAAKCKKVIISLLRVRILPSLLDEHPKQISQELAISELSIDGKSFPLGRDLRSWKNSEAVIKKFRESMSIL